MKLTNMESETLKEFIAKLEQKPEYKDKGSHTILLEEFYKRIVNLEQEVKFLKNLNNIE